MNNKISICIPAYNEALRIPPTLDEILNYIRHSSLYKNSRLIDELVIVDDASRDSTLDWVEKYREKFEDQDIHLTLIQHMENSGKWAAIRTGIKAARNDLILLMDADGSAGITNLERIKKFDRPVFASRFMKQSKVEGKSASRTIISYGYRMYCLSMYAYASGRRDVNDMQCPFKLFRKSDMRFPISTSRYAGDIELALSFDKQISNLPVDFIHMRGSKVRMQDVVEMTKQTFQIAKAYRRMYFQ